MWLHVEVWVNPTKDNIEKDEWGASVSTIAEPFI